MANDRLVVTIMPQCSDRPEICSRCTDLGLHGEIPAFELHWAFVVHEKLADDRGLDEVPRVMEMAEARESKTLLACDDCFKRFQAECRHADEEDGNYE